MIIIIDKGYVIINENIKMIWFEVCKNIVIIQICITNWEWAVYIHEETVPKQLVALFVLIEIVQIQV